MREWYWTKQICWSKSIRRSLVSWSVLTCRWDPSSIPSRWLFTTSFQTYAASFRPAGCLQLRFKPLLLLIIDATAFTFICRRDQLSSNLKMITSAIRFLGRAFSHFPATCAETLANKWSVRFSSDISNFFAHFAFTQFCFSGPSEKLESIEVAAPDALLPGPFLN